MRFFLFIRNAPESFQKFRLRVYALQRDSQILLKFPHDEFRLAVMEHAVVNQNAAQATAGGQTDQPGAYRAVHAAGNRAEDLAFRRSLPADLVQRQINDGIHVPVGLCPADFQREIGKQQRAVRIVPLDGVLNAEVRKRRMTEAHRRAVCFGHGLQSIGQRKRRVMMQHPFARTDFPKKGNVGEGNNRGSRRLFPRPEGTAVPAAQKGRGAAQRQHGKPALKNRGIQLVQQRIVRRIRRQNDPFDALLLQYGKFRVNRQNGGVDLPPAKDTGNQPGQGGVMTQHKDRL